MRSPIYILQGLGFRAHDHHPNLHFERPQPQSYQHETTSSERSQGRYGLGTNLGRLRERKRLDDDQETSGAAYTGDSGWRSGRSGRSAAQGITIENHSVDLHHLRALLHQLEIPWRERSVSTISARCSTSSIYHGGRARSRPSPQAASPARATMAVDLDLYHLRRQLQQQLELPWLLTSISTIPAPLPA